MSGARTTTATSTDDRPPSGRGSATTSVVSGVSFPQGRAVGAAVRDPADFLTAALRAPATSWIVALMWVVVVPASFPPAVCPALAWATA
jgi:hypothetical protein